MGSPRLRYSRYRRPRPDWLRPRRAVPNHGSRHEGSGVATADDPGVQSALSQAYESGALRGARFKEAKRIIANYSAKRLESGQPGQRRRLTGEALVREYQQRTREQQALVKRATRTREKLLMLKSAMQTLLGDEYFVTLLRAEELQAIPEQLVSEKA